METVPRALVIITFLCLGALNEGFELFDSAKKEAEEFIDEFLSEHLPKCLPSSTKLSHDFSCDIRKDLLAGFIPTHRDIHANFTSGHLSGLSNINRRNCNPSLRNLDESISLSCTFGFGPLTVEYQSAVTGFNLIGSTAEDVLVVHIDQLLLIEMTQKLPQDPVVKTLTIMNAKNIEFQTQSYGFNSMRLRRLRECVAVRVQHLLEDYINHELRAALQNALKSSNAKLPDARLDSSEQ